MKRSSPFRLVPAALACAVLVAAAKAPAPATGPAAATTTSACAGTIQSGGATAAFGWANGDGFTQPVAGLETIAGCSFDFNASGYLYGSITHVVVAWDPVAMAADPTTVALRTTGYFISAVSYTGPLTVTYSPAIVRRQLPNVAEALPSALAMDWTGSPLGYHGTAVTQYDTSGATSVPAALWYSVTTSRQPLPGSHPVLMHTVCAADSVLGSLTVVQSVVRADAETDAADNDLLQVFRVPVRTELHWVEVAEGWTAVQNGLAPGILSIVDPAGSVTPPVYLQAPVVQAYMPFTTYGASAWQSHYDFDHTVTLQPAHDYWLVLHTNHNYRFYSRTLHGNESANFTSHVGALWVRPNSDTTWTRDASHALDFRLVGEVLNTTAGVPAAATGEALRLRALSNPARGAVALAWSGARGALRFEVLDVRGRRVGAGETAATPEGRWSWSATRPDGGPLPAGVYFVRAADRAGSAVSVRIVLVH